MEQKNNKREKGTATGCTQMKMVKYGMECVDRGVDGKKKQGKVNSKKSLEQEKETAIEQRGSAVFSTRELNFPEGL